MSQPGPPPQIQDKDPAAGFLSPEHKKRFMVRAGIFGGLFVLLQFFVPFVMVLFMMPNFFSFAEMQMGGIALSRGAVWQDALWRLKTEDAQSLGQALVRTPLDWGQDTASEQEVWRMHAQDVWLLPQNDRLWLLAPDLVAYYDAQGQRGEVLSRRRQLGDISRPFLYQGSPAVLECMPSAVQLRVLEGEAWGVGPALDWLYNCGENTVQVLGDGEQLHIFLRRQQTLYYHQGLPGIDGAAAKWRPVGEVSYKWRVAMLDGKLALLETNVAGGQNPWQQTLRLWLLEEGAWRQFYSAEMPPTVLGNLGFFPLPGGDALLAFMSEITGTLQLERVDSRGRLTGSLELEGPGGVFKDFSTVMGVSYGLGFLSPLVLVVILAVLMGRHKRRSFEGPGGAGLQASLIKRSLAKMLDLLLISLPMLYGYLDLFEVALNPEAMFEQGPSEMLQNFMLIMIGLGWSLVLMVAIAIMEGVWGASPGKWLLGLRVLRSETLAPCGILRGLLRNLLLIVDGFLSFLVGILAIAFSEHWQRVGDLAAGTVVLDVRKKGIDRGSQDFVFGG